MSSKFIKKFAKVYHPILQSTLKPFTKISEISQNQGSLSLSFLPYLPESCQFYQVDSPMQDYTLLSYRPNPPFTYLVPGSLYSQLFPTDTMDVIYALQVFNQSFQLTPSSEHLIPSLSPSEFLSKILKNRQKQDLARLLKHRHSELVQNGSLIFDLILKPTPSTTPYSWDCLDLAVKLASEKLPKEAKNILNLHTVFRTPGQVNETLEEFKSMFSVEVADEHLIVFDEYQEFLKNGDFNVYYKALEEFWKGPVRAMMKRALKAEETKVEDNVKAVFELFREICNDMKPKMEQRLILVKLRKL